MLRTTVDHQRQTATKDASGGEVVTFAAVNSGVRCDIQPASASVALQYMERQMNVSHTIYFGTDIQAKPGDRFVSGTRNFKFQGYRRMPPGYGNDWPGIADVEEQL